MTHHEPPVPAEMDTLARRCDEILSWYKTGIYEGDALQAYADRLEAAGMPEAAGSMLRRAEAETIREALSALSTPPGRPTREEVEELEEKLKRANRAATDHAYMLASVVQMLGPKGRQVWDLWQAQGVQRIHTSWGPDAAEMSGEQIAQAHLDMEDAIKTARPYEIEDSRALGASV